LYGTSITARPPSTAARSPGAPRSPTGRWPNASAGSPGCRQRPAAGPWQPAAWPSGPCPGWPIVCSPSAIRRAAWRSRRTRRGVSVRYSAASSRSICRASQPADPAPSVRHRPPGPRPSRRGPRGVFGLRWQRPGQRAGQVRAVALDVAALQRSRSRVRIPPGSPPICSGSRSSRSPPSSPSGISLRRAQRPRPRSPHAGCARQARRT
jgi:hypothetical protein